jgi:hypothetical protein
MWKNLLNCWNVVRALSTTAESERVYANVKKDTDSIISSQAKYIPEVFVGVFGRFRDYNGELLLGAWYSPFLLETISGTEPPDPGSIPGPATRKKTLMRKHAGFLVLRGKHTNCFV